MQSPVSLGETLAKPTVRARTLRMVSATMIRSRCTISGFSLVELLVTMAITAILVGVALPHLDIRREKTNTVIQNFVSDVRWARSKAIINGTRYCVHFISSNRYQVRRLVLDAGGTTWLLDKTIKDVTIPSHMGWSMQTDTGSHLQFNTRGMQVAFSNPAAPYPLSTTFWDNYGASHVVTVWPSGQAHEDY